MPRGGSGGGGPVEVPEVSAIVLLAQTDDHQARVCPRLVIACPMEGCKFIVPAVEVEDLHITTCTLMRVHLMKCRLSVRVSKLVTHDFVK